MVLTETLQGLRRVMVEVDVDVEVEEMGGREGMARRTLVGASWRVCRTSCPKEARDLEY